MKPRFLLPHSFKKVGWIVLIPSIAFGIFVQHFEYTISGFELTPFFSESSLMVAGESLKNNLTNELAGVLVLISACLVAFSKEKAEDERVSQVRLESLQWSVYLNYALLLIAILFIYNEAFFYVMIYNMFTILIFFIIRFNFVLNIKDRIFHKAETA